MNVINTLKLLVPHQVRLHASEDVSQTAEPVVDANEKGSRGFSQLELYSALLDRTYIHQIAAEAVISNRSCQEAEQRLDELAKLSLDRLTSDYEKREEFIERGRKRAETELEEARKHSAAPDPAAVVTTDASAPAGNTLTPAGNTFAAARPDCDEEVSERPIAPLPAPVRIVVTPSAREKELEQELAEAQNERRGYSSRLSNFEKLGHSPGRSTAMRLFGATSLAGSVMALAILFDSLTRDFPLFRDLIDGMRATFLPSTVHSQSAMMLGFLELASLFFVPVGLAFFFFRGGEFRKHADAGPLKEAPGIQIWGMILLGLYVIALVATFSTGETASRLLLDFALSLGVTGVSASLVFFSVTRSGRMPESAERPWWGRWERTLLPFGIFIPLLVAVMALTASFGPWVKLVPAALLACVLMIGSLALAYGMLFRDFQSEIKGCDARIAALRADLERERQLSYERAESANAKISAALESPPVRSGTAALRQVASDAAENVIPQIVKAIDSHSPQQYAAAIKEILKPVLDAALSSKNAEAVQVETAERSLRVYEAAITHLENRYSELVIEHATGWAKARIELRTAYALCSIGAKVRPHAAVMEPSLLSPIDKSLPM